jgi:16S rRNA U516 pseudouridylate synthase RsuA-like enzyme
MVNSENFYPCSQLARVSIEAVVLRGLDPDDGDYSPLKASERCHRW